MVLNKIQYGRKRFVANLLSQYGLQIAKYIIPLITLPYLSRVLGPDAFAIRTYMLSVSTLMQSIGDFGFSLSATRDIVRTEREGQSSNTVYSEVLLAKVFLLFGIGIAVLFASWCIPILTDNSYYLFLVFCSVAITSVMPDFVFIAAERMKTITVRYILSKGIGLLLLLVLVKSSKDLLLVPLIDVLTALIALVWSIKVVHNKYNIHLVTTTLAGSLGSLKRSARCFVVNFSSTLFNSYTTLALGVFLTNQAELAYWGVSISIIGAIQSLYSPIANSLYPHMLKRKDFALFWKMIFASIPCLIIAAILIYVFSPLIIYVVSGPGYETAVDALRALSPVLVFSFFSVMFAWPSVGICGGDKLLIITALISGCISMVGITAIGIMGICTLLSACLIRVFSEVCLAVLRIIFGVKLIKNSK